MCFRGATQFRLFNKNFPVINTTEIASLTLFGYGDG